MTHISERQKKTVVFLTGIMSLMLARYYITIDAPYELYFAPSVLVPTMIGYLLGAEYAGICCVFGLAMFQPFFINIKHGWVNLIYCVGILVISCGTGYFQSKIRMKKEPFFAMHLFQIVFALGFIMTGYVLTPILAQKNSVFPVYAYSFFSTTLTHVINLFFVEISVLFVSIMDSFMLFSFVRNFRSGEKKWFDKTMDGIILLDLLSAVLIWWIINHYMIVSNSNWAISITVNTYQNDVGIVQLALVYEMVIIFGGNIVLHMIFNYLESQNRKEEMAKMQQAIFDASNDIIMGINGINGEVIIANHTAEKFLKSKNAEYQNMRFLDIFDPENVDFWEDSLEKANEKQYYRAEYFNDDTKRFYDMQIYRIDLPCQENDFAIFAKDITDEVLLNEQLEEINDELENRVLERTIEIQKVNEESEKYGYMIAHELKAPLRAIKMYNEIVQNETKKMTGPELSDAVRKIEKYCDKSLSLIQEILFYSKEKTKKFKMTRIKMNPFVDSIVNEMRVLYREQKIEVVRDNLPEIMADEMLMHSCIQNILSNAVKYSSKREITRISITCETRESDYMFHIQDNGVGFSMKESGNLFELFGRLHSTDEYEGNGVGLVMVKNTIELHGGVVMVEAEKEKGCRVSFSIPK